jgi:hypothetical protein
MTGMRSRVVPIAGVPALLTAAILVVALLPAGSAHAGPNLVVNGDFASDISGWTAGAKTTAVHTSTEDADGLEPASGAARLTYTGLLLGEATLDSGCITLTGAGDYPFAGATKTVSGNGLGVLARITVTTYTDACTTPAQSADSNTVLIGLGDPLGWQSLSGTISVSASELYASVQLRVIAPAFVLSAGHFDNVSLADTVLETATPSPTNTPTATDTPSQTGTPSSATDTPSPTPTPTPASSDTPTPTDTSTVTPTATVPAASTASPTVTSAPIASQTATGTTPPQTPPPSPTPAAASNAAPADDATPGPIPTGDGGPPLAALPSPFDADKAFPATGGGPSPTADDATTASAMRTPAAGDELSLGPPTVHDSGPTPAMLAARLRPSWWTLPLSLICSVVILVSLASTFRLRESRLSGRR